MSDDNVVHLPGVNPGSESERLTIPARAVLEAIAEECGDSLSRVAVVAIDEDGSLRLFHSDGDDDQVIADMTRALHGFVASTLEDG